MTRKIKFEGKEMLLIGGAIATQEQFENFEPSYAHLFPDGVIRRYGEEIGLESDIEYLDKETQ